MRGTNGLGRLRPIDYVARMRLPIASLVRKVQSPVLSVGICRRSEARRFSAEILVCQKPKPLPPIPERRRPGLAAAGGCRIDLVPRHSACVLRIGANEERTWPIDEVASPNSALFSFIEVIEISIGKHGIGRLYRLKLPRGNKAAFLPVGAVEELRHISLPVFASKNSIMFEIPIWEGCDDRILSGGSASLPAPLVLRLSQRRCGEHKQWNEPQISCLEIISTSKGGCERLSSHDRQAEGPVKVCSQALSTMG